MGRGGGFLAGGWLPAGGGNGKEMLVFYRFTDIIEGNGLTRVAIVMLALAVSHGAMSGASPAPRKAVSSLNSTFSPGVSTTVRAAKNGRLVRTVVVRH